MNEAKMFSYVDMKLFYGLEQELLSKLSREQYDWLSERVFGNDITDLYWSLNDFFYHLYPIKMENHHE